MYNIAYNYAIQHEKCIIHTTTTIITYMKYVFACTNMYKYVSKNIKYHQK